MGNGYWCEKCKDFIDFKQIKKRRWESSKAIVEDSLCPGCHEVLDRKVFHKTLPNMVRR